MLALLIMYGASPARGDSDEWGDWAKEGYQGIEQRSTGPQRDGRSQPLEAPEQAQFERLDGSDLGDYQSGSGSRVWRDHPDLDNDQPSIRDQQQTLLQQMEQLERLERMEQVLGTADSAMDSAGTVRVLQAESIESVPVNSDGDIDSITTSDQDFSRSAVLDKLASPLESLSEVTGSEAAVDADGPGLVFNGSGEGVTEDIIVTPELEKTDDVSLPGSVLDAFVPDSEPVIKD